MFSYTDTKQSPWYVVPADRKWYRNWAIAQILTRLPGFEGLPVTYYPNRLSDAFAELPGVREERIYSDREPTAQQQYAPRPAL